MPHASVTSHLESLIGDYGLYAVFLLMFIDAVFPAASELVMLYAGALAAGAFSGQHVVLFGHQFPSGWQAYLAVALAGTIGYTLGAVMGWAIGLYGGRPLVERHGRWLHLDAEKLDRAEAWFGRYGDAAALLGRVTPARTPSSPSSARPSGASRWPGSAGRRAGAGRPSTTTSASSTTRSRHWWCSRSATSCTGRVAAVGNAPPPSRQRPR